MVSRKAIVHFVHLLVRNRRVRRKDIPASAQTCQDCARRWEAAGYDPDVRCPRHQDV
jgi:hypothetical protein